MYCQNMTLIEVKDVLMKMRCVEHDLSPIEVWKSMVAMGLVLLSYLNYRN